MAFTKIHESFVYAKNAGADLSGKLNYLAKVDTDGDIILASAQTDMILGNIVEAAIENSPVTVQFGGIGAAIAGGAITAGDKLTADSNGKVIATTTASHRVIGIALSTVASGSVVSFVHARGQIAIS